MSSHFAYAKVVNISKRWKEIDLGSRKVSLEHFKRMAFRAFKFYESPEKLFIHVSDINRGVYCARGFGG